jgi:phospholipid/cholesterol/gamma-HCH transport system ATP-binding protein
MVRAMGGGDAATYVDARVDSSATGAATAIECRDVHKAFGPHQVLDGVDLRLPDDTISLILGPSGTGKSVLIKHLIGLLFPDAGDVLVHGRSVPSMTNSELLDLRTRFGICFQDGALFGSLSVYDNVAFPLRQHTDLTEAEIRDTVMQRLADVGLADAAYRLPAQLSGGMRKRAGFARALVMEPQIVLFDEPDSGLDPVRTGLLCELIQAVHSEHGGAFVVITHNIMAARQIGEYVAVLWNGKIVDAGEASDMFNSDEPFIRQFLTGEPHGPLGMD